MSHADLLTRHLAVMPSWMTPYYEHPIQIVRGFDRRLVDGEGKTYLDFFGGIAVNSLGYSVPEVRDSVRRQLARGVHHTSTCYLIEQQVELAERIARLSEIPDAKVFFVNSGTEAMEAALLFATTARRSSHVLTLRNGYHGRSFGSNAATSVLGWNASRLSPLQVSHVHNGHQFRGSLAQVPQDQVNAVCLEELRELIATIGGADIAAFVAEPMQGVGGLTIPPDGLLRAYQDELREHGIPVIVDEVQTGWGRLGSHFWGSGMHGITPDVMTFAKGLGSGFTIGGVVGRPEIIDSVTAKSMSTFGGNPIAMAAGLATVNVLLSQDLQANAEKVGEIIRSGLDELSAGHPQIGEVRGRGLLLAIEIVVPGTTDPDPAAALRLHERARELGLLVGRGGPYGNVIRISPALNLSVAEAQEGLHIIAEAVRSDRPSQLDGGVRR
ncbi:aspartate aminotransferase family protein [Streptomyces sp. NPDC054770]